MASPTSCAGVYCPSEAVLWVCRSAKIGMVITLVSYSLVESHDHLQRIIFFVFYRILRAAVKAQRRTIFLRALQLLPAGASATIVCRPSNHFCHWPQARAPGRLTDQRTARSPDVHLRCDYLLLWLWEFAAVCRQGSFAKLLQKSPYPCHYPCRPGWWCWHPE